MSSSPTVTRTVAIRDLVLIIGTLVISKSLLLQIETLWAYAGPISLFLSVLVATLVLNRSGEGWKGVGVRRPASWRKLAIWTVAILVLGIAADILIQVLSQTLFEGPDEATQAASDRHQGRFDNLPGNLPVFLMWLALAWVIGGFIEEMLFRGAMITRFEQALKGVPFAVFIAIILQAVLFGQQHFYYQGLVGAVATGVSAVIAGVFYLLLKRNLWALILSHGLNNTIGLTILFYSAPG